MPASRISFPCRLAVLVLALLATAAPSGAGPAIPGVWRNLGPDGGGIVTLATHPTDPNLLYAGGDGGVYRSRDGGASWSPANRGLSQRPNLSTGFTVIGLVLDPKHPSILYAALRADGVARSTDGGESWTHVDQGLPNLVTSLALDPTDGERLFVAAYDGLYRSEDGGSSWRRLEGGLPQDRTMLATSVALDPQRPSILYAAFQERSGTACRVYKSSDGGGTWRSISSGPLAGRFVVTLAVDPKRSNVIFAACRPGLLKSTDGGSTWRETDLRALDVFALAFHPIRSGTIYAGSRSGTFRSSDSGATWSPSKPGRMPIWADCFAFSPDAKHRLYAGGASLDFRSGGPRGVFRSTDDARSWTWTSHGIRAHEIEFLTSDAGSPAKLWIGGDGDLQTSRDRGATWKAVNYQSSCLADQAIALDLDPTDPDTAYLVSSGNRRTGVCATHDGGASWSQLFTTSSFLRGVRVDPQAPATVYAFGDEVRRSGDGGATWSVVGREFSGLVIRGLEPSPATPGTAYAWGIRLGPSAGPELFRTDDAGATWRTLGIPWGSALVESLVADPAEPKTLYAVAKGKILRSLDGGEHWSEAGDGFSTLSGFLAAPRTAPGRLYFAAQGDTVYESLDGGATWSPLGGGPDYEVFDVPPVFDARDPNRLYVGARDGALLEFTRRP